MTTAEKKQKHEYYMKHRKKIIARSKQWALDHPERTKELNKIKSRNYEKKHRIKRLAKSKKYYEGHKEKSYWATKNYYAKYPGKFAAYARKKYYGLSVEQFNLMIESQNGCCAICRKPMKRPSVDHDHTTGKVRELLCSPCNVCLGMAKDNVVILESAIQYLIKHKEQTNGTTEL